MTGGQNTVDADMKFRYSSLSSTVALQLMPMCSPEYRNGTVTHNRSGLLIRTRNFFYGSLVMHVLVIHQ
jgi:hypothetical protein